MTNKTNETIQEQNKETKINYLLQIGLFKEEVLREMNENQINELTETAVKIKGY